MSQPLPRDEVARRCWCGATQAKLKATFELDDGERFPLVACCGCGVGAIYPQPTEEALSRAYSAEYYGASRQKFVKPIAAMVGWLQSHRARRTAKLMPRGGRLLDVGCGNGEFLLQMQRRGFAVEGTEWSAESATRVPGDSGVRVHVGDLLEVDLPANSYDLVSMWHVLEHVRQPDESLQKIHRLLKADGRLMLALPNAGSAQARRFGTAWLHYDPPRHLFHFGTESLRQLLEKTGFETETLSTKSIEQNTFGFVQSWLNQRGYPRDRLYGMMKGTGRTTPDEKAIDLLWLGLLGGPGLVVSSLEARRGDGATIVLTAKKRTA